MSSAYVGRNGNHEIAYYFQNPQTGERKRHILRLGQITTELRGDIQSRLDLIVKCREYGLPLTPDLRHWLRSLGEPIHSQLTKHKLVRERLAASLGMVCDTHIQKLKDNRCAKATIRNVTIVTNNLRECFGEDRLVQSFTVADARQFFLWLTDQDFASSTISRRCRRAREIFATAIENRWLRASKNPFREMKGWNETNHDRDVYIPWNEFCRVIDWCLCPRYKLFLVITRCCGIRSPSDVMPLKWSNIDRNLEIMRVSSTKNKRFRPSRDIPIFKELRPFIDKAFSVAPEGVDSIFYDLPATPASLADRLESLCRKAGIAMWPKPFVNLRASGERDMWRVLPYDEVTAILDHSPETAQKHYSRFAKELRARAEGRVLTVPNLEW